MKNLIIAISMVFISATSFAQKTHKATKDATKPKMDKYHDNIDNRMKGPNGEVIYMGEKGGRYYMKGGKKVYVEYKGNKKK